MQKFGWSLTSPSEKLDVPMRLHDQDGLPKCGCIKVMGLASGQPALKIAHALIGVSTEVREDCFKSMPLFRLVELVVT